jgi:hypothetical protein
MSPNLVALLAKDKSNRLIIPSLSDEEEKSFIKLTPGWPGHQQRQQLLAGTVRGKANLT